MAGSGCVWKESVSFLYRHSVRITGSVVRVELAGSRHVLSEAAAMDSPDVHAKTVPGEETAGWIHHRRGEVGWSLLVFRLFL